MKVKSLCHVRLFETPWTAVYQAPLSMGFSGNSTLSLVLCEDLPGGVRGGKFKREGTYVYFTRTASQLSADGGISSDRGGEKP